MDKPHYKNQPIGSVQALSDALRVHPGLLKSIASRASDSYHPFTVTSKSGKERDVHEPKTHLKRIQKRINREIFESVNYPSYLKGSIRDTENPRDYIRNAQTHSRAETLIGLDISNFFPSITSAQVDSLFKQFFKFPSDVSELLTSLTTKDSSVPQGACSSSYIANLVFFNSEYRIVSKLRKAGITYTRLLDDITLSSSKRLTDEQVSHAITLVVGLFTKFGLANNEKKKFILNRNYRHKKYDVTGVWVGNRSPRLRKSERRYIRQLVYECEKKYAIEPSSEDYNQLWNKTSGLVAKMTRLNHSQANGYRLRLSTILPTLSEEEIEKVVYGVKRLVGRVKSKASSPPRLAYTKTFNRLMYKAGLIGRTDKVLAKSLKLQLSSIRAEVPTKEQFWMQNG